MTLNTTIGAIDTVVWDMGGIFRAYFTEAMLVRGRAEGWPLHELRLGPTGLMADPEYDAMARGDLGEHDYLDRLLAHLGDAGIDIDPLAWPSSSLPDRPATWALIDEVAATPDRRQAILTNDASRWLGTAWWERWPDAGKFDAIVDSSQVGVRKPHRAMYDEVMARLGNPAAATCVFVDDMHTNLEGARSIGMDAVWFDITDPEGSIARVRAIVWPDPASPP